MVTSVESTTHSPYPYLGFASQLLYPETIKPRGSSLSVQYSIAYHFSGYWTSYKVFGRHGVGMFTETHSFFLDQPLYVRHSHSYHKTVSRKLQFWVVYVCIKVCSASMCTNCEANCRDSHWLRPEGGKCMAPMTNPLDLPPVKCAATDFAAFQHCRNLSESCFREGTQNSIVEICLIINYFELLRLVHLA